MPYRQESVTSGAVVDVQPAGDTRSYQRCHLSITGGTVRLITDGQDPTATDGKQLFGGERWQDIIQGAGNVRQAKLIAESATATVGIDLQVH